MSHSTMVKLVLYFNFDGDLVAIFFFIFSSLSIGIPIGSPGHGLCGKEVSSQTRGISKFDKD